VTIPDAVTSRRMEARAARVEALARIIAQEYFDRSDDPLGSSTLPLNQVQRFVARADGFLSRIDAARGEL
jgi:hypothetical protein